MRKIFNIIAAINILILVPANAQTSWQDPKRIEVQTIHEIIGSDFKRLELAAAELAKYHLNIEDYKVIPMKIGAIFYVLFVDVDAPKDVLKAPKRRSFEVRFSADGSQVDASYFSQ